MTERSPRLRAILILLAVLAPAWARATDMPPVELLFILPLFCMAVFTALGWSALRRLSDPTARHFARLFLVALLWTPVPDNLGYSFMLSGISFWSFLGNLGNQSPDVVARTGSDHLAVAIAVGVVCVLGGVVVLTRSLSRLRQLRG